MTADHISLAWFGEYDQHEQSPYFLPIINMYMYFLWYCRENLFNHEDMLCLINLSFIL